MYNNQNTNDMKTNDTVLLQELQTNVTGRVRAKLSELYEQYDLCVLGDKVHEAEVSGIVTQVLQENDFRAKPDFKVRDENMPRPGERVTTEEWSFLLSSEDFDRLMKLCVPRWHAAGLTDEKGTSTPTWTTMKIDARNAVLDFVIENIIPSVFRADFRGARNNYTIMEKLLDLSRKLA